MSASWYWERDLEKDDYVVEYRKDSKASWLGKLWQLPAITIPTFGHSGQEEWLGPTLYKGTSDRENRLIRWIRKLFS